MSKIKVVHYINQFFANIGGEEKADYKKSLIPYVVGAALVFTASIFAQSIYEFFSGWGN